ncbi:MAG: ABC transporter substrate-binding protein [bacterium]
MKKRNILMLLVISISSIYLFSCTPVVRTEYQDQSDELYELGMEQFREENYADAVIIFKELQRTYSEGERSYHLDYMIALTYYRLEKVDEAKTELNNLINRHGIPQDIEISSIRMLAQIDEEQQNYQQALHRYVKLYSMVEDPDYHITIREKVDDLSEKVNSNSIYDVYKSNLSSPLAAYLLYQSSVSAFGEGNQSRAEEIWKELTERFPNSEWARYQPPFTRSFDSRLIGVLLPLEGEYGSYGQEVLNGIKLAIKNSGYEIVVYDTEASVSRSRDLANQLIYDHGVIAIIGPLLSTTSLEVAKICNQAGVPMVNPTATQDEISQVGQYIFQLNKKDETRGIPVVIKYACENLNLTNFVVICDAQEQQFGAMIVDEINRNGGFLQGQWSYQRGQDNFSWLAEEILVETDPQAIFIEGRYNEIVQLAPAIRYLGCDAQFLGSTSWDDDRIIVYGEDAVVGAIFAGQGTPGSETISFITTYSQEYGHEPVTVTRLGYDAAKIILTALSPLGELHSPLELGNSIMEMKFYRGISGGVILDPDLNFSYNLLTIRRGRIIPIDQ